MRNKIMYSIGFVLLLALQACKPELEQPNILFIICDQMSPRAMGWVGETEVSTPTLDEFSRTSYCFTNAYCTSPVCAPARHSIYTGVYPSRHQVKKNDTRMSEEYETIMSMFNSKGYTTANIGKMHNAPYHHRRDFQYVLNHEFFVDAAGISHYEAYLRSELEKRGIEGYNPYRDVPPGKIWLQVKEGIANVNPLPADMVPEQWMTRQALKFMDDQETERPGQPFFLHLSYFPPHHPYMPVAEFADPYLQKLDDLELPPNYDHQAMQRWCRSKMSPDSLSVEDVKYFRAMYFGFLSQLDAALGDLFAGMEERGLMDNTIVVFTSDHGDNLGEHGKFYKGNMYEGSVRVPLMVHWPAHRLRKQKLIGDNVSHVDLVPTLLQAAGIESPDYMAGKNMMPLLKGKESWEDHSVYSEFYSNRGWEPSQLMLKKGDLKLVYTADTETGDWETWFYDTRKDPWEMNNLDAHPDYAVIQMNFVDELMNDYWNAVRDHRAGNEINIVPRVSYDIKWPADPWSPVRVRSDMGSYTTDY